MFRFNALVVFGAVGALLVFFASFAVTAGSSINNDSDTALADPTPIQPGHSTHWYNSERSGEGWVLEIIDDDLANMYWFTYDEEGSQRWLTGTGQIGDSRIDFPDLLITQGGRFGPDFDPDEVSFESVGQMYMSFDDCVTGTVDYELFGQRNLIEVERLGWTMAADCSPVFSEQSTSSRAAHSGSWYDPSHTGEGFVVQWLDRGEAAVTWFSYDPDGNQYWMIGTGALDEDRRLFLPELYATHGSPLDPEGTEQFHWGTLTLDLSCDGGMAEYDSVLPEFGSGTFDLSRLTALDGVDCPLFMPEVGNIASAQWDTGYSIAGVSSNTFTPPQVYDFELAEDGSMYAAGYFSWFGDRMVPPLLSGSASSGEWEALLPDLNLDTQTVTALANDPLRGLALARQPNGVQLADMSAQSGEILLIANEEAQSIAEFNGAIRRLVWFYGELWAAGSFYMPEHDLSYLAIWDGRTWRAPPGGEPNAAVLALSRDDGDLLIGGAFDQIGGIEALGASSFDGESWTAYDLAAGIHALENTSHGLIAGGYFVLPDQSTTAGGVARWNGDGWEILGGGLAYEHSVGTATDLHEFMGDLYAIGCFQYVNGAPAGPDSETANGIARWTGERWESLDNGQHKPSPAFFSQLDIGCAGADAAWAVPYQRLASDQDHLYIGGAFPGFAGTDSHSLIGFDGEQFLAQGSAGPGRAGNYASSLAVGGPDDAAYGLVWAEDPQDRLSRRPARWNEGEGWEAIGPVLPHSQSCSMRFGDDRNLIISPDGDMYLKCHDLTSDATGTGLYASARILYLDDNEWVDVEGVDAPFAVHVRTMRFDPEGRLWIAGGALHDGLGAGTGYVARMEDGQIEMVEDGFDGPVRQLSFAAEAGDNAAHHLVAGGTFTRIGSRPFSFIAHWDGEEWSSLGDGLPGAPGAVEYGRERIYASVNHYGVNLGLGAWDGDSWTELATADRNFPPLSGAQLPWFSDIHEVGQRLYLAGNVVPDLEHWPEYGSRLYIYENGRFESLGGGVVGSADRMEMRHDSIFFMGSIIEADPAGQPVSSLGIGRLMWP